MVFVELKVSTQRKIGFWSVASLVAGSQIGSGIFLLPASLAIFGAIGLSSWLITASGAILLALVFAKLCAKIPKTGGPHTYIEAAFGKNLAFFAAWTYWLISWISSTAVVIAIVGNLSPLTGPLSSGTQLAFEILILLSIMFLNLRGVRTAGRTEFVFTLLKILPLFIVPLAGIFFIHPEHFLPFNPTTNSTINVINAAALLTLWGFIGVESATTPAESVINPSKTIPKAIIMGTVVVAVIYIVNSVVIMGIMPPNILSQSTAPFADASAIIFGGNWHFLISLAASIVCLGTLNAWVLTSSQIALGAANDGHFPAIFKMKNTKDAPVFGLLISSLGMIPILIITLDKNLVNQVNQIIDISVTAFLFIYLLSTLSYLKLCLISGKTNKLNMAELIIGIAALLFCLWALWASGIKMVSFALLLSLTGLPIYWWQKKGVRRQPVMNYTGSR